MTKKIALTLIISVLCFLNISVTVFAQDTIFYKKAGSIVVFVKEVSQTEVQYKKVEMPDGPMYIIDKNDIAKIVYKNGFTEEIKAPVVETTIGNSNQPFTVTYSSPADLNYEKITYSDTKRSQNSLIRLVDRHPDPSRHDKLMKDARAMRSLKRHQDGTRTGAIIFGGVAIGGAAVYSLISAASFGSYVDPIYAAPPVLFGTLAVILGGTSIAININLKKKRNEFVNYYNQ